MFNIFNLISYYKGRPSGSGGGGGSKWKLARGKSDIRSTHTPTMPQPPDLLFQANEKPVCFYKTCHCLRWSTSSSLKIPTFRYLALIRALEQGELRIERCPLLLLYLMLFSWRESPHEKISIIQLAFSGPLKTIKGILDLSNYCAIDIFPNPSWSAGLW